MNQIENEEESKAQYISDDNEENYEMEGVELTSEGHDNQHTHHQEDAMKEIVANDEDNSKQIEMNNYNNNIEISPGDTFYITNHMNQLQMQSNSSFYPKNNSMNGTLSSNQSIGGNQMLKIKEGTKSQLSIDNNNSNHNIEGNSYNKVDSFPATNHIAQDNIYSLYTQLLPEYRKVLKEKSDALSSLKNEMLTNEQQRTYISLQKSVMNEMMASQKQITPQYNYNNNNINNKLNKIKQNNNQGKVQPPKLKEEYADILMEIPILREQLKESQARVSQIATVVETMSQRESDLITSIEKEAQLKLTVLEDNKTLNDKIDQLTETIDQYKSQFQAIEKENNAYKDELNNIATEKANLVIDLNKERTINQISSDKITQLANDIEKKTDLIKEAEKEIVVLTLNERTNLSTIAKLNEEKALLAKNIKLLKEKESELNKDALLLKEEIKSLNKEMDKAMKDNSVSIDQKERQLNENLTEYNELKSKYELLQNESNNQLILISGLKEKIAALSNQTKEDKEAINIMSMQIKDYEVTKSKLDSITKDYEKLQLDYKDNIEKVQSMNNELSQIDKDNAVRHIEELNKKDKEIFLLKSQLENPKEYPNMKYYNPRLAIQSCLIASNHLIEKAHSFYSEKDYHIFLESVAELRRELSICFDALSNGDEVRALTIQNEQCIQELNSYKNDNKKLFDYGKELKAEINTLKEYNDIYKEYTKRILGHHISNKAIKDSLNELIGISIDSIELMREYDIIDQRNSLLYKRNQEVFNLFNEGKYKQLGIREQQLLHEYNNANELKERIRNDIGKLIQRKEDLNQMIKEIENDSQNTLKQNNAN